MKKILFITDGLLTGGPKTYLIESTKAFTNLKVECTVVTFDTQVDFFPSLKHVHHQYRVRVAGNQFAMSLQRILYLFRNYKQLTRDKDCIIIDLFYPALAVLFVHLLYRINTKIIYQFHGSETYISDISNSFFKKKNRKLIFFIKKSLEKWCYRQVDTILTFSNFATQVLKTEFKTTTLISQLNPGIEDVFLKTAKENTKQDARRKLGLHPNIKLVVIVARLDPVKGIFELIELVSKHNKNLPKDCFFIFSSILNDNSFTDVFFKLHSQYKLGKKMIILNNLKRGEIALLYRAADLTLFPSIDLESFGLTTLESLSVNTQVLAFNIGANSELLDKTYLIDIRHKKDLIRKINEFFSKKLKKNIFNKKCYSWEKYAIKVLSLL